MTLGDDAYRYSSAPINLGTASTVVAATIANSSGDYVVNATATGFKASSGGYLVCHILEVPRGSSHAYSATPWGYDNTAFNYATTAEDGILFASASATIQERCLTNAPGTSASPTKVLDATLNATLVNHVNGFGATKPTHRTPVNTFVSHTAKPTRGASDHPTP
jgi:hypothetical protein